MKVPLFDIENQFHLDQIDEAQELVRLTREYDINSPQPGQFHVISRQPDYHVEIHLNEDSLALVKCQCPAFKRTGYCTHAIGALLLLRDHQRRNRTTRKKNNKEHIDEILSKLSVTELKSFVSSYAMSHAALRAELMSNYLYLTKKPDYQQLYQDLAPIDRFGQMQINRNNLKSIRSVSATLLKRAQQLLKDQSLSPALSIFEAVIPQLHRISAKAPQFIDQLSNELKHAYRLFELFCSQPMAPRLQMRVTALSLYTCGRASYVIPSGMKSLLQYTENFFLEEKRRKEAVSIAEQKLKIDTAQELKWAMLLLHWKNLWKIKVTDKSLLQKLDQLAPDAIREFSQQAAYEDALFVTSAIDRKKYSDPVIRVILMSALRAAKMLNRKNEVEKISFELATHYLDLDAWLLLLETDRTQAIQALQVIETYNAPLSDAKADHLLLTGWRITGNAASLLQRIKSIGDIQLLMEYDDMLTRHVPDEVANLYASLITSIREAYGGVQARQKLNNIFSHLKASGMHQMVTEKVKNMDKKPEPSTEIKGFVFDLDGVIVDTAVHHFQSWQKIMKQLGADITEEDDHHTRGAGRMESLQYLLDKYGIRLTEEEKLAWAAKKNTVYLEAIEHITPRDLLPGAQEFLDGTRILGLQIALGSASKNARSVLKKLGIADSFDAIIDGNDAKASKPDPEVFSKACIALGLKPSSVVVFEDASKGIQAAISAGCKTVGIGDPATLPQAQIVIPGLHAASPATIIEQFK